MKRDGRTAVVLTSAGRVYSVDVSGRGDGGESERGETPSGGGGEEQHYFSTSGGCKVAVDAADRVLVLDENGRRVHVHSQTDGHLVTSMSIGQAERPSDIDVCATRLTVLDRDRTIIVYNYSGNDLEFVARLNADGSIADDRMTAVVSELSSGQQYMWGCTGELGRLYSLSLDGRLRRLTGVACGGGVRGGNGAKVHHLAVNKHQLVVSRCREVAGVLGEGGEEESEGREETKREEWTIHRYRIVNE